MADLVLLNELLADELGLPMWRALSPEAQRDARRDNKYNDHCYASFSVFNDLALMNVLDGHKRRHYTLNLVTGRPTKACENQQRVSQETLDLARKLHAARHTKSTPA